MLARGEPAVLGAAQLVDHGVVDRPGVVLEQAVVDVDGPLRRDLADVVDDLGDLVPGRVHRQQQRVDGAAGDGERVARVEDRAVRQVADVGDARDVGVDDGVQLAVHLDVEAGGGEGVALADGVHPAGEGGGRAARRRCQRPDLGRRVGFHARPQPALVEVVRVLMGDQDRVRADRRVLLAEHTGVDDERLPVLLQPDTGMGPSS